MDLFLIRHAIAEEARVGLADDDRRLTGKGKRRFLKVVRGLERLSIEFSDVYSSPWRRALETARLLAPLGGKLHPTELLAAAPSEELLSTVAGDSCALVGHEPWMSELAAWLVTGSRDCADAFAFKKGGVLWLEGIPEPRGVTVRALFPPRFFRTLQD